MHSSKCKTYNIKLVTFLALLLVTYGLVTCDSTYADVKLKVAIVNPSTIEKQTTPIRYDLPKGIGPEQIVDIGTFEMKYDFGKGNYYLEGTVTLQPSEKKVLEITLRDVWNLSLIHI